MEHHIVISILLLLIRHLSQFLYNEKLEKEKTLLETQLKKGEFVVHISDESYVAAINETAANLPPNESEIELAKLTPIESDVISVPGVKEANIRMECVLERAIPLAEQKTHQLAIY